MSRWWCLWLALASVAACDDDEPIMPGPVCPNAVPVDGEPCAAPGLVCSYFTTCELFFEATCTAAGTWSFEDGCPSLGEGGSGGAGAAGAGGSGGMATTTSGAGPGGAGGAGETGGAGGMGGAGTGAAGGAGGS